MRYYVDFFDDEVHLYLFHDVYMIENDYLLMMNSYLNKKIFTFLFYHSWMNSLNDVNADRLLSYGLYFSNNPLTILEEKKFFFFDKNDSFNQTY